MSTSMRRVDRPSRRDPISVSGLVVGKTRHGTDSPRSCRGFLLLAVLQVPHAGVDDDLGRPRGLGPGT